MNDKLQESIAELIDFLRSTGEDATIQMPIIAQEYVTYYWWSSLVCLILSTLPVIAYAIILVIMLPKMDTGTYGHDTDRCINMLIVGVVLLLIMSPFIAVNGDNLIKATMTPRVLVLEKFASTVKAK